MEAQDMSSQEQDVLADQVMGSLGEPDAAAEEESQSHESAGETHSTENGDQTLAVQKRLKAQKRAHEREIRELHARMAEMQRMMPQAQPMTGQEGIPYGAGVQPGSVEEQIHKAVSYALNHKEMEERKAKEAQAMAHVYRKYQDFDRHLNEMSDKYDDFDEVVRHPDTPFTEAMRNYAARTMSKSGPGSAGEVLYKLAKNPDELRRISSLHPDDQAEELHKLSIALSSGGSTKASQPRPLGQIKSNPVTNSHVVTEKTPVGSIRQRMKSGQWK